MKKPIQANKTFCQRVLTALKPLAISRLEVSFAKDIKYLGVAINHKLTWNFHIQKNRKKDLNGPRNV